MFEFEIDVEELEKQLKEKLEGDYTIKYTAPHSVFVEFGTEPHMPPVEPLIIWARRKLGLNDADAKKAGWAIAMTIKKYGQDPRPFLRTAIEIGKGNLSEFIKEGHSLEDFVEYLFGLSQDIIIEKNITDEGTLLASGGWGKTTGGE